MAFKLRITRGAQAQFDALASSASDAAKHKKVQRCLARLQQDPRQSSLNSHKYSSMAGANGEDVWDSYVENNTPSAWRVFWHYGPAQGEITVIAITPHP